MTRQDVLDILDKDIQQHKVLLKIFIVIGALLIAGGALWYFLGSHNTGGLALGGLGLFMVVGCGIMGLTGSHEKKINSVKEILTNNPKEMIWGYVREEKNRGVVTVYVDICLRAGTIIPVNANAIPSQNATGLLLALKEINPGMHVGWSEELKYKFKNKTL